MLILDPVKWFGLACFVVELEQQEFDRTREEPTAETLPSGDSIKEAENDKRTRNL